MFGASQGYQEIAPVPIDIGNGLPFVQRIREWSRWTEVIKRKLDNDLDRFVPQAKTRSTREGEIENALTSAMTWIEHHQSPSSHWRLESPSLMHRSPHWQATVRQSKSVTIGRVVYPTNVVQQVQKEILARWDKGEVLPPNLWKDILGPHEFLSLRNGLQLSFTKDEISKEREFLLIRLSPKEKDVLVAPLANDDDTSIDPKQAPDLEIYLDIDRGRQTIALKEVRAVLRSKMTDLMLPQESNDLRFVSEQYAISSEETDPNLSAFIKASNLALWGSERLKTPSSLVLDVPRFSGKDQNDLEHQGPVEYAFTTLEHRTQIVTLHDRFGYEYTTIGAGRTGGERQEFRIYSRDQSQASSEEYPKVFQKLFREATEWITDMSQYANRPSYSSVHRVGQLANGELNLALVHEELKLDLVPKEPELNMSLKRARMGTLSRARRPNILGKDTFSWRPAGRTIEPNILRGKMFAQRPDISSNSPRDTFAWRLALVGEELSAYRPITVGRHKFYWRPVDKRVEANISHKKNFARRPDISNILPKNTFASRPRLPGRKRAVYRPDLSSMLPKNIRAKKLTKNIDFKKLRFVTEGSTVHRPGVYYLRTPTLV